MSAYDRGFAAGLNSRPRRGRTDAYDLGYDKGIETANEYLSAGFERGCGGFTRSIAHLLDPVFVSRRKRLFSAIVEPRDDGVPSGPNAA